MKTILLISKMLMLVLTLVIGISAFAGQCLELNGEYIKAQSKSIKYATQVLNGVYVYNINGQVFEANGIEKKTVQDSKPGTLKTTCSENSVVIVAKEDSSGYYMTITIVRLDDSQVKIESSLGGLNGTYTKK